MRPGTILLIAVILALIGVVPVWPYAGSQAYGPSGLVSVVLLIQIVRFVMGRL